MNIQDKNLEEILDNCIKKSMNSLPIQVILRDETQLNLAQTYLKGKRNTKALILKIGEIPDSHKFPDDSQYIRNEVKKIEVPEIAPVKKPRKKKLKEE